MSTGPSTPSSPDPQTLIDVRPMPPRERHPKIFATWGALPDGGSMILVNDHDPLPLYYQFAAEHAGGFRWEYQESGPEVWRVCLSRGAFADPGFMPVPGARSSCRPASVPISFVKELVLDVRPLLERGESPCQAIESAIGTLVTGQSLVVLAPFEPIPLYAKLGRCGFAHDTTRPSEGLWRVEFKPTRETDTDQFEPCGCQHD